jgi:hypothetical protein
MRYVVFVTAILPIFPSHHHDILIDMLEEQHVITMQLRLVVGFNRIYL